MKSVVLASVVWATLKTCASAFVAAPQLSASGLRTARPRTARGAAESFDVSEFCIGTNAFWKQLVVKPVLDRVATRPARPKEGFLDTALSPPEVPGIPRPVWLTIAASVPTGLGWYGYYKFCVEEELFQMELEKGGKVTGCGGYGTLLPFVFGVIIGGPLTLIHCPGGPEILQAASAWILLGQVNLYRRVNEFFPGNEPLHPWWALLPPPLDVVVGLRQVHFLSEFWKDQRGLPPGGDQVAETYFPFISAPRFTLKQFARTPSMWFWFTKDAKDLEFDFLRD